MNSVLRISVRSLTSTRIAFSFLLLMALFLFIGMPSAFADTPIWSFKGAKWYSLMETGNVTAGVSNGIVMLDGATGKPVWQRSDLGDIKEEEYTELPGTPLILISDNSGWAQRKTKITALDTLTGATVWPIILQRFWI